MLLEALLGEMVEARADGGASVAQVPEPPGRKVPAPSGQVAGLVAPALADALKHDGRGAFGCVAVSPPSFLAEDEALDIIRAECAKAGLKLREGVVLDRVETPVVDEGRRSRAPRVVEGDFEFDFASEDGTVFLEYLSGQDYENLAGDEMSSVQSYDFPELLGRMSKSLGKRRSDQQVVYGLFFDPLASVELEYPALEGLTPRQRKLAREQYARAREKAQAGLEDKAKDKLRAQLRHFLDYLKEQRRKEMGKI